MQEPQRTLAEHQGFVRSQLRRFGAQPGVLDDLTQEVWLVSLARAPSLLDERATRAWLTQVCRRVAAGERRVRARFPLLRNETPDLAVEPQQVQRMESELDEQECLAALSRLSEEQLDVLSLYGSGELSMREVADLIGAPERTVYSRYRAAVDEVSRELRRCKRVGLRSSIPPPMRASSPPPSSPIDLEAAADAGALIIYRCDDEMVLGRLGNVVVSRWRKRLFERTMTDIGHVIDLAHSRMRMRVVMVNDGDADLRLPNAAERVALRHHIREHSHKVARAVDILNSPVTRLLAAIVNGILLVSRSTTSFTMVPSVEQARRWAHPHAFTKDGPLAWERVAETVQHFREQA